MPEHSPASFILSHEAVPQNVLHKKKEEIMERKLLSPVTPVAAVS